MFQILIILLYNCFINKLKKKKKQIMSINKIGIDFMIIIY